jgi:4-amino-4-deoxy-L-arabinose transferase-like glycosyltransferase
MAWGWASVIVVFFTLSTFKLDHYVYPAAPALCLLCARAWTDERAGSRLGRQLIGPFLVLAGTALGFLMVARLALPASALLIPVIVVACGILLTARSIWRPRAAAPPLPSTALMATIAMYAGVILFVIPRLEERKVIPDLARWVAAHAGAEDRIASFELNRWTPAFRFYVGRHTTFLDDSAQAEAFFEEPSRFYVAMRRDAHDAFVAGGAPLEIVYEREGMPVTSGRVLWRRSERHVRYVVATKAR